MFKLLFVMFLSSLVLIGCRPEDDATNFSVTDRMSTNVDSGFISDDPLLNTQCSLPPEEGISDIEMVSACEGQVGIECQAVYGRDTTSYVGCIPVSDPDQPRDDSFDDDNNSSNADDSQDNNNDSSDDDSTSTGGTDSNVNNNDDISVEIVKGKGKNKAPINNDANTDSSADIESIDKLTEIDEAKCDQAGKKVFVCHTNNGSKKQVTICIAVPAWLNAHQPGHKGHWGEDKLGACQ